MTSDGPLTQVFAGFSLAFVLDIMFLVRQNFDLCLLS